MQFVPQSDVQRLMVTIRRWMVIKKCSLTWIAIYLLMAACSALYDAKHTLQRILSYVCEQVRHISLIRLMRIQYILGLNWCSRAVHASQFNFYYVLRCDYVQISVTLP